MPKEKEKKNPRPRHLRYCLAMGVVRNSGWVGLLVLQFVPTLRGLKVGLETRRLRIHGCGRRGHGQRIRFPDHPNGCLTIIPPPFSVSLQIGGDQKTELGLKLEISTEEAAKDCRFDPPSFFVVDLRCDGSVGFRRELIQG